MTAETPNFDPSGLDEAQLRALILDLTGEYARRFHAPKPFVPGQSPVPVSGKVYGDSDMRMLVDSSLDFWLTTGRFNDAFEARLAERLGVRFALTTNSGSSANLLALSALTSKRYMRDAALKAGDEVITVATGFPTTVNPSLQYGLVPVFVDVAPGSPNRALLARYGIDPSKGFPALVVSDEALKVAEVTKAGEAAALGAKGKDEVRAWLLKRFKADPQE